MNEEYHPNSVDAFLSRVETKLDAALLTQREHEKRIKFLEGRWQYVAGIAAAVSAAIAILSKFL